MGPPRGAGNLLPQTTGANADLLETLSQADSEITFDQISGYPAAPSD